MTLDTETHLSF